MILIGKRFVSAEHIISIDVQQFSGELYTVIVKMTGGDSVFGQGSADVMDQKMAHELRKRIDRAIVHYKSSDKPEIQHVDFPKYEEVHQKEDSDNS